MADPYISRKEVNKSYRPQSGLMSPGLQRARAPFRVRNAITGLLLAGFATGVWAYSISAVKQDDFSDIDEEAKALARANPPAEQATGSTRAVDGAVTVSGQIRSDGLGSTLVTKKGGVDVVSVGESREEGVDVSRRAIRTTRGVLARALESRQWTARLLDPERRTFVWGAPSVDGIGRLGDKIRTK